MNKFYWQEKKLLINYIDKIEIINQTYFYEINEDILSDLKFNFIIKTWSERYIWKINKNNYESTFIKCNRFKFTKKYIFRYIKFNTKNNQRNKFIY